MKQNLTLDGLQCVMNRLRSLFTSFTAKKAVRKHRPANQRHGDILESRCLLTAPHPFDLGSLTAGDGSAGFVLNGIAPGDRAGYSARTAGDINGDGFDDFVIGANRAKGNAQGPLEIGGEAYVVFGTPDGHPAQLDLSTLNGTNGFRIPGQDDRTAIGLTVGSVGDVNGDGFHDLFIDGYSADDPDTNERRVGEAYIIFGRTEAFPAVFNTDTLDGTNGFTLVGTEEFDAFGLGGFAGDINGDGFDDLITGAPNRNRNSGIDEVYLIYGKADGFDAHIRVADLDGSDGFIIPALDADDRLGRFPGKAGDMNGDGYADVVFGASRADANGDSSGEAYVLFGRPTLFPATFDLNSLDGTNGFLMKGVEADDWAGERTQFVGDLNGDGFHDIGVGADRSDNDSGEAYVIFGAAGGFPAALELSGLNGTNGFKVLPIDPGDQLGISISTVGDLDGDGYDDLGLGAQWADPGTDDEGEAYVIFGKPSGWTPTYDLTTLDGDNGFRLEGSAVNDFAGKFVNTAGDINGDGFSELIVTASDADPNGVSSAGRTYVVYGSDFRNSVTHQGDANDDTLTGTTAADIMIGGRGSDTLIGNGGADVLRGGAGDDVLGITDLNFQRVDGGRGYDTLRLDGAGTTIDLMALKDANLTGIEAIDLKGTGSNALTLTALSVLNLSDTSNTLTVRRDGGDVVNMDNGWTQGPDETIGFDVFSVFTQGEATVKIQNAQASISVVDLSVTATAGTEAAMTQITVILSADRSVFADQTVDLTVTGPGITLNDYILTDGDPTATGVQILIPAGLDSGSVTLTVVDDRLVEDDETATLSISNLSSNLSPGTTTSQTILITSDDVPGFTVTESASITEVTEAPGANHTDTFSVVLDAQPAGNVVLNIQNADSTELTTDPSSVTFTPINWNVAQSVAVSAMDDSVVDGNRAIGITIAVDAASDPAFVALPDQTLAATTIDDDIAGFRIVQTDNDTRVEESGTTDSFDIVLLARPLADVVITVTNHDAGEVGVDVESLTFTTSNWNQPQPVTVSGISDTVVDGNQATAIVLAVNAAASDAAFANVPDQSVTVTTLDDDAGFVVTESDGSTTVSESGSTDSFSVVLIAQPPTDVVLKIESDETEATVERPAITFTPANWFVAQTVIVTGVDDLIDDEDQFSGVTIAVNIGISDPAFADVPNQTISVTTTDDDTAGFTLSESAGATRVTEAGETDSFSIVLDAQPVTDVVLTITSGDPAEATVSHSSLAFTPHDWNIARTVTVAGVDDVAVDGDRVIAITTSIDQANSDAAFGHLASQLIAVTSVDDDVAGYSVSPNTIFVDEGGVAQQFDITLHAQPLTNVVFNVSAVDSGQVSIDQPAVTFTPGDWNSVQTVTVVAINDAIDEEDQSTFIEISIDAINSDDEFDSLTNHSIAVTTADDDTRGIVVSNVVGQTSESGASATFTVVLTSEPTAGVTIGLTSSSISEGVVSSPLTFTPDNWHEPQTVTITGVDDDIDDGDVVYTVITEAATGGDYTGIDADDVSIVNTDDDTRGVTVSGIRGSTTESGGTATFTIVLDTEPTGDVTIESSSSNPAEGIVAAAPLTFTRSNWNQAQTITVTGVDDLIDDDDVSFVITTTVSGADYTDATTRDVNVTNLDNDDVNFFLTNTDLTISESGTSDTFSVVLNVQPMNDVVIDVFGRNSREASVSTAQLVFTPTNWNSPQTVTVTGQDDEYIDGSQSHDVLISIDGDASGIEFPPAHQWINVTTTDDETAAIVLNRSSVVVGETGTTDSFTVVLGGAPLSSVILNVTSSDPGEATIDRSTLRFTTNNWNIAQTVTITGIDDYIQDGNQTTLVELSVDDVNSHAAFAAVNDSQVTVTTTDRSRFSIDVDGNGTVEPLTDGILLVRYLAGFTGDALVTGAVGRWSQRSTSQAIIAWLAPHRETLLDADGDGASIPLTDGIVSLRYMAGFRGDSLINGAVSEAGTRTTANQIEDWIEPLSDLTLAAGPRPASSVTPMTSHSTQPPRARLQPVYQPATDKCDPMLQYETSTPDEWRTTQHIDGADVDTVKKADRNVLDLVFRSPLDFNWGN